MTTQLGPSGRSLLVMVTSGWSPPRKVMYFEYMLDFDMSVSTGHSKELPLSFVMVIVMSPGGL